MLSWLFRRRTKEKYLKLFSQYVDRELVEKIAAGETFPENLNDLSERAAEYVFALVEGATPNDTARHLGSVATIAQQNGWMVQDLVGNLAVLVHGAFPACEAPHLDRVALAGKLLQALESEIKVVHGHEMAHFGKMGSASRMTYGVLLPSFIDIVTALVSLPSGNIQEYGRGKFKQ